MSCTSFNSRNLEIHLLGRKSGMGTLPLERLDGKINSSSLNYSLDSSIIIFIHFIKFREGK